MIALELQGENGEFSMHVAAKVSRLSGSPASVHCHKNIFWGHGPDPLVPGINDERSLRVEAIYTPIPIMTPTTC